MTIPLRDDLAIVIYLDMDHFFTACEEARNPSLKGKPLVVGTASEEKKLRGVVQTCNYEARKFGIHSGMPTSQAYSLCKELAYKESDDAYYQSISDRILSMLKAYGFPIEAISIDEFAIGLGKEGYGSAILLAKGMMSSISSELGLACTIGISFGKTMAKMVCDDAKPAGLASVDEHSAAGFLHDKGVEKIPGVGLKTYEKLRGLGINTMGDLAATDPQKLLSAFGSFGGYLYSLSRGQLADKVSDSVPAAASLSREKTLDAPTADISLIEKEILELASILAKNAGDAGLVFKTIGVKMRYSDFTEKVKSRSFLHYTGSPSLLGSAAAKLARSFPLELPVRKVGVRISSMAGGKGQRKL